MSNRAFWGRIEAGQRAREDLRQRAWRAGYAQANTGSVKSRDELAAEHSADPWLREAFCQGFDDGAYGEGDGRAS